MFQSKLLHAILLLHSSGWNAKLNTLLQQDDPNQITYKQKRGVQSSLAFRQLAYATTHVCLLPSFLYFTLPYLIILLQFRSYFGKKTKILICSIFHLYTCSLKFDLKIFSKDF